MDGDAHQARRVTIDDQSVGNAAVPRRRLSMLDVLLLTVGIVIGAGIFRVPPDIARAVGGEWQMLALWLAGGLAALTGALCYAELATRFPSIGGEYHFLRLAWGPKLAAWFVWARMAVIQTGSIATVGFVAGDYAAALWPDGPSPAQWAAMAVAGVTAGNMLSLEVGRRGQQLLQAMLLTGMLLVIIAGFTTAGSGPVTRPPAANGSLPLALVFVMLSYGGWNEAAYLSAETRRPQAIVAALVGGLGVVALLYLLFNWALLHGLGLSGIAASSAPAAQLVAARFGPVAGGLLGLAVVAAALSTMNTSSITGARAICALGGNLPALRFFSSWDARRSVPRGALAMQGLVTLLLTAYGAAAADGFAAMVAFGAPVFWLFLGLTALALFRLRRLYPEARGFSVPLYPLVPLLFAGICGWMLWSSLQFALLLLGSSDAGRHAGMLGVALLLAGLPLALKAR